MEEDNNAKVEQKRQIYFIIGFFVIIAVAIAAIFYFIPDTNEEPEEPKSDLIISEKDQLSLEAQTSEIMDGIGNFGVSTESLTADNALDVEYIMSQTPNDGGEFYTSRKNSYESIRDYILKGSPIDYTPKVVSEWVNDDEIDSLVSYELVSENSTTPDKGTYINIAGVDEEAAYVDVNFTTKETIRQATADDTSWDGSYSILEKNFPNNTMRLTFVKDGNNEWKLYSLIGLDYKFLLSTWENPSSFDTYATTQYDFKNVGKLEREEKLKPPE